MPFDRRAFLLTSGALLAAGPALAAPVAATVTLDSRKRLGAIAADYMGLGYEITTIAYPDVLSARNKPYVQLVKNLGAKGIIRIGGNSSDYSRFDAMGKPEDFPRGTVVNTEGLKQLRTFLDAVNWRCIWGLNLGDNKLDNAIAEAKAVTSALGPRLLALEIGNEPDVFGRNGHRMPGYDYAAWHADYQRWKAALRAVLPQARFAGPDVTNPNSWVPSFAKDEGHDIALLTAHHYITGQSNPMAGIDAMLAPDKRFEPGMAMIRQAGIDSKRPWRICETASFSGGGKKGASDSFASALWALDYLFVLATAGCGGVNMETGVNHLGWVSHYSPIDEWGGGFHAAPEYYGLLAFAQAGKGNLIATTVAAGGANLTAYATHSTAGTMAVVINKDRVQDAAVAITGIKAREGHVTRLTAPGVEATTGVTLGGAMVADDGSWKPAKTETAAVSSGQAMVQVPAASAVLVHFPG